MVKRILANKTGLLFFLVTILPTFFLMSFASTDQLDEKIKLHLVNQDSLSLSSSPGFVNDTFAISGYALTAHGTISFGAYTKTTYEKIYKKLSKHINRKLSISPKTFRGNIILDIESPVHMSNLYKLEPTELTQYISATNLRVKAAKKLFPMAKLGLHALYSPISSCLLHRIDTKRISFITKAFNNNYFPIIDFFTVNLYLRYGEKKKLHINDCIINKFNHLRIKKFKQNINIFPLLSLRIYNVKSSYNRKFVDCTNKGSLYLSVLSQISLLTKNNYKEVYFYHPNSSTSPKNNPGWSQAKCLNSFSEYYE